MRELLIFGIECQERQVIACSHAVGQEQQTCTHELPATIGTQNHPVAGGAIMSSAYHWLINWLSAVVLCNSAIFRRMIVVSALRRDGVNGRKEMSIGDL